MAHFTSMRNLKWHYTTTGQGEALFFIHGFAATGGWWHHQASFLQDHCQVITIDLPGHGQTPFMPLSLQDIAIDIRQLIVSLGLSQVTIVASSMGGLVAFELYRLMPQQIMRMSLVGSMPKFARTPTYGAGLDIEKIRTMSKQFQPQADPPMADEGDYVAILDIFFRSLFSKKEREAKSWLELKDFRQQQPLPDRAALQHFLEMLERTDLRDKFSSVICPLQFVAGSDDYICTPDVMQWMQEHAYNARFDVMAGGGHLPFLTDVHEYNRLLEDFLIS